MDYSRFIFNPSLSASTGYTSYAVVHQTGRFTRYTAESPAAAWYFFSSFFKKIHNVNFFEKRAGFFRPAGGETQPLEGRPRNSCRLWQFFCAQTLPIILRS
jgi:hypothetical protein